MLPQPSGGLVWVQAGGGPALACQDLSLAAHHLYTTRRWVLGSGGAADAAAWAPVAAAVDVDLSRLLRVRQVHGASVVVHRAGSLLPSSQSDADIIVTDDVTVALAVQTADCVALLLADRRTGSIAAAHAGWRGLAARVPSIAVRALARAFGSRPEDLVAAIGPSISVERYEVGGDVRERFAANAFSAMDVERWFAPADRPDHWFFDGWESTSAQLAAAGVHPGNTHTAAICTATHPDLLCSYRRDGEGAGRMAAVIRAVAR